MHHHNPYSSNWHGRAARGGHSSTWGQSWDSFGYRGNQSWDSFGYRGNQSWDSFGYRGNQSWDSFGYRGNQSQGSFGYRGNQSWDSFGYRGNQSRGSFGYRGNQSRGSFGYRGNQSQGSFGYRGNQSWGNPRGYNRGSQRGWPRFQGQGREGHQGYWGTSWNSVPADSDSHRGNRSHGRGQGGTALRRQQQQHQHQHQHQHEKQQILSKKFLDFCFLVNPEVVCLMKEFKVMFILRGLSGSGKSTLAEAMLQVYKDIGVICSADYYRYNKHGEYVWHADALEETHAKCQRRAQKFCALNKPVVIIDNTNIEYFEMQPYFQMARRNGYVTILVEPKTPWKYNVKELAKRNEHNVSFTKLAKKYEQFDVTVPVALYFGWFLSPNSCSLLEQQTKEVLQKCLTIPQFKQFMASLTGKGVSQCTLTDVMSLYFMTTENIKDLHVTACFSPRGKYLRDSPYAESVSVVESLGHISTVTIIGWVLTSNTFSARVVLTEKQKKLWNNHDGKDRWKKEKAGGTTKGRTWKPIKSDDGAADDACIGLAANLLENMTMREASVQEKPDSPKPVNDEDFLKPDSGPSATSHITLGRRDDTSPVQAKHDMQKVIDYELSCHAHMDFCVRDWLPRVRRFADDTWVISMMTPIKVPAIFAGFYSDKAS